MILDSSFFPTISHTTSNISSVTIVPSKSNKNILTLITCVKDKKNLRLCVQASEKV